MVLRSRLFIVSMKALSEQGSLGALIVRLMMVMHDLDIANFGNQTLGAARHARRIGNWRTGAGRYFLRLQISHMNEGLRIIRQIEESEAFRGNVLACDRQTQKSYARLVEFLASDDWKRMNCIRNKIGFHYDQTFVRQSLRRIERRRQRQVGKRRGNIKGIRQPVDLVQVAVGPDHKSRRYDPQELVENDMIVHEILNLKESDSYAEDKELDEAARMLQRPLHHIQNVFGDFAYNFVRRHSQ